MKSRYLFVFMLLYICGTAYVALSLPSIIIYALLIAVFICAFAAKTKLSLIVTMAFSLCFLAGCLHMSLETHRYQLFEQQVCDRYVTVFATVDGIPETLETSFGGTNISYPARVSQIKTDNTFYKTNKKIIVYAPEEATVSLGDTVIIKGFLKIPDDSANPGGFDYRNYLRTNGIAATMTLKDGVITGNKFSVFYEAEKLRHVLINKISEFMPDGTDMLVRAILLGDKENLSDDVQKLFQGSGLSHALALSGMHLSILAAFIMWFVSKTRLHLRIRVTLCAFAVIAYVAVAGFSPSLVRAAVMSLFLFSATLFKRRYDFLTAITAAAAILIFENPFALYSVSFQLSFAATLGIIFLGLPLHALIRRRFSFGKVLSGILMTVILSSVSSVVTLPLIAKYFGNVSIYTVLGNLFIIPLIEILFGLGIIMLAAGAVFAPLAKIIGIGLALVTKLIVFITKTISSFEGAFFVLKAPNICDWILYASVIAFLHCLIRKPKLVKATLIPIAVSLVLCMTNSVYQGTFFRVEFLDVGQGDCTLVQIPFGNNVLIDCGPKGFGEAASYIKSKGIRSLDVIYLSHFDADHSGGLDEILSSVKVKEIVAPYTYAVTDSETEFLNNALKYGVNLKFADDTYTEKIGDCTIEALWPGENIASDTNNNSLVLKLNFNGKSVLFTGDIDDACESRIISQGKNINADIVKIAHHGSATSTSAEFIEKTTPEIAVISAAENNSYGHPHKDVLSRLEAYGCRIFRTDKNGYVHFSEDIFGNFKIKVKSFN